jgi:ferredoxin-NADP reductase
MPSNARTIPLQQAPYYQSRKANGRLATSARRRRRSRDEADPLETFWIPQASIRWRQLVRSVREVNPMPYTVKILETEMLNHNVKRFTTEKPQDLNYTPGQAVLMEIPEMKGEKRPFTFTGLLTAPCLEFTIKLYHDHEGVTDHLTNYEAGDSLRFGDPWGAIKYKGPGIFLAGGAGITPFLAILRNLYHSGKIDGNALWFSNKTDEDLFLEDELREMLGDQLRLLITRKASRRHENARIDREYLQAHAPTFDQNYYVCGPKKMVKDLSTVLRELGVKAEDIVTEDLDS